MGLLSKLFGKKRAGPTPYNMIRDNQILQHSSGVLQEDGTILLLPAKSEGRKRAELMMSNYCGYEYITEEELGLLNQLELKDV